MAPDPPRSISRSLIHLHPHVLPPGMSSMRNGTSVDLAGQIQQESGRSRKTVQSLQRETEILICTLLRLLTSLRPDQSLLDATQNEPDSSLVVLDGSSGEPAKCIHKSAKRWTPLFLSLDLSGWYWSAPKPLALSAFDLRTACWRARGHSVL